MRKGDIYHDGKHPWLITDVAKKTKKDDIRLYDDEFNEAPLGQKFVYAVNVNDNCTTQGREKYETLNKRMKFLGKANKCSCPNCDQHHPPWGIYYNKIKELNAH